MEGGAMNTCLRVLKETKWILSFWRVYLKFIEYFPDYLSVLSRTLFRFFWTTFVEAAVLENEVIVPSILYILRFDHAHMVKMIEWRKERSNLLFKP